jgi:hypothetical protein
MGFILSIFIILKTRLQKYKKNGLFNRQDKLSIGDRSKEKKSIFAASKKSHVNAICQ